LLYGGGISYADAKHLSPWELQLLIDVHNEKVKEEERAIKEATGKGNKMT